MRIAVVYSNAPNQKQFIVMSCYETRPSSGPIVCSEFTRGYFELNTWATGISIVSVGNEPRRKLSGGMDYGKLRRDALFSGTRSKKALLMLELINVDWCTIVDVARLRILQISRRVSIWGDYTRHKPGISFRNLFF